MSLTDWMPHRRAKVARPDRPAKADERADGTRGVPDGVWSKCASCNKIIYQKELKSDLMVCPSCGYHYQLTCFERVQMLTDPDSFQETDADLTSADPLGFMGDKPYADTLDRAKARTGLSDAIVIGTATIGGVRISLGVMDFRFVGASMGSVVGEKITRAAEAAEQERIPLLLVTSSGGARMQEGLLSLWQMAKTSAAVGRLKAAGIPYISVLTDPTTGGVSASFATLADVILAEPGALICFAGPRVIEQTIKERLPKGFQRAEFLLEHGLVDQVVHRSELTQRLATLLSILDGGGWTRTRPEPSRSAALNGSSTEASGV